MRKIEHLLDEKFTTKDIWKALCVYLDSYLDQNYYLFAYRDKGLIAFG